MKPLYLFCALLSLTAARAQADPAPPVAPAAASTLVKVGAPAPALSVRDDNGVVRTLAALRGKKNLLLTFFPKCFTSRCAVHLGSLRDSYAELQKADIDVWAVSVDPAEGEKGQKAFAEYLKLPFPLIPDPTREVCLLYGAAETKEQMAKRMSVFIDKQGVVRWVDLQIDPSTHGADVLKRWKDEQAKDDAVKGGAAGK